MIIIIKELCLKFSNNLFGFTKYYILHKFSIKHSKLFLFIFEFDVEMFSS